MSFKRALAKAEKLGSEPTDARDPKHGQAVKIVADAARRAVREIEQKGQSK